MQSKDSVIWITGATGGFGRELALKCAQNGAKLVLTSRSKSAIEELAAECEKSGSPKALAQPVDVRDAAAVAAAADSIYRAFQGVDGLVASAADVPLGDLQSLTDEDWMYGIQNKLLATVYCLRAVLPRMRERKRGRVVVLSGSRGFEPMPKSLLPGAINAALNNVVKGLSREYARDGVAINTVSPSLVMTPRGELYINTEAEKSGRSSAEIKADWTRDLPSGRFVRPEEIVNTIYGLLFSMPDAFTGQTVMVDGGESRAVH